MEYRLGGTIASNLRIYQDAQCTEIAGYQPAWVVKATPHLLPENYKTSPTTVRETTCPIDAKSDTLACTSTISSTTDEHDVWSVACSREGTETDLWNCRCIEDGKTTGRVSGPSAPDDPGFIHLCWDAQRLACLSGEKTFCADE
jgi:hypothetical protein